MARKEAKSTFTFNKQLQLILWVKFLNKQSIEKLCSTALNVDTALVPIQDKGVYATNLAAKNLVRRL